MTVDDDQRPRAISVEVAWDGDDLVLVAGRSSSSNIARCADVSLLWAPYEADGYSLIVDGSAVAGEGGAVRFSPTNAVLHRTRPRPGGVAGRDACEMDCVPVLKT